MNAVLFNFDPLFLFELIIAGFLVGIVASMVGIGGGLLLVPMLMFFYALDTQKASAISLFVMIFTSLSGTLTYHNQKRIDLRTGLFFAFCVLPSSFVGSWVAELIDENILVIIFGLLLLYVSLRKISSMIFNTNLTNNSSTNTSLTNNEEVSQLEKQINSFIPLSKEHRLIIDSDGKEFNYYIHLRKTLLGAIIGGFLGGLLGVGGGIIFVPVLNSMGGVPIHIAVATSTFVIICTAISGTAARLLYGEVMFDYVLPLVIGTVIGARIGALKVKKISSKKVLILFYTIVFISGMRTVLKGLNIQ